MLDWLRLPNNGSPPTNVSGSTAVTIKDTLYVFGGCYEADEGSGNAVIYSSDLHAYDAETGFWTRKLPSPLQPCARAGHCMVGTGSSFYVICGRTTIDDKTTFLGDVFVFDTLDKIWSPVRTAGPNPVGRAHASACYLRGSIYVFGGCNGTVASSYRNDIMILSLENLTWTKCVPDSSLPAGRAQHSMVASGGILYVFGGSNLKHGRKNALGDLNTFNTIKKQWTQLVDTGQGVLCPEPRWGHVMFEIKGGLFVFAGVGSHENEDGNGNERFFDSLWVFNTVSKSWLKVSSGADDVDHEGMQQGEEFPVIQQRPTPRAGLACAVMETEVLIFGGHYTAKDANTSQYYHDLYSLEASLWRKVLPEEEIAKEHQVSDFTGRALAAGTRKNGRRSAKGPLVQYGQSSERSRMNGTAGQARGHDQQDSQVINWKLHIIEGLEHPTPRSGHAMAPWYRRVFLFGGLAEFKGERKYVSDMWSLNLDNFEWEEMVQRAAAGVDTDGEELHECPCGRAGHNMVAIQSSSGASGRHESFQLYVLFGWCMKDAKPAFLGDISRYDSKTSEWTTLKPAGTQPPARSYAGCAVFKGDIYVFGGCNGSLASNFRNDMWVYETKDNYWQRVLLPQDAIPPPGRSQHAMVQYGGALYVFGGNNKVSGRRNLLCDFYSFDPIKIKWQILTDGTRGEGPGKRSGHAMSVVNGGIFLFGGGGVEENTFLDSLWVYDTAGHRWHVMAQEVENGMVGSKRPCGRAAHCMYSSGSGIYVSGGLAADGKKGIHSLEDVASFDATTWRRYVPKVVSQRHRQGATRLLAKLQGLDDHSSSRLLESMSAFKGKAREVYDELLNDPFATLEENEEINSNDDGIVVLSPELSAQMSSLSSRIDTILGRIDPQRALTHRMQRAVTLGPVLSKGGVLHVDVVCGRDLPKMDRFGKSDPYVIIDVEGHTKKTSVKKRTLNPTWREKFVMSVSDSNSSLIVTAYDWDFADDHDLMGYFSIPIFEILENPVHDQFYTLRDKDGYPAQGAIQLRLAYQEADSEFRNMRTAVSTVLKQLPHRDAEEVVNEYTGRQNLIGHTKRRPSLTVAQGGNAVGGIGGDPAAKAVERVMVQQLREENLQDMELSRREELEAEMRAKKTRELERLRRLKELDEEREARKEEMRAQEEESTELLETLATRTKEAERPPYIPSGKGVLKAALEGQDVQVATQAASTANAHHHVASFAGAAGAAGGGAAGGSQSPMRHTPTPPPPPEEGSEGSDLLNARLKTIEAKRNLRIKLYTYKRGQKREEKILDPKLKERQMQAQLEVEEALRVEAEREKERQHKAEMMRKTLMMEQHQRAIRKLEQRREDQLTRREAEEAENKLAEERAKAELARKRKEKVEEIALEKERTKTERRDRLRAGYRISTAGLGSTGFDYLAGLGGSMTERGNISPSEGHGHDIMTMPMSARDPRALPSWQAGGQHSPGTQPRGSSHSIQRDPNHR